MSPDQMDELWSKPARLARASAAGDAIPTAAGSRAHPGAPSRPSSASGASQPQGTSGSDVHPGFRDGAANSAAVGSISSAAKDHGHGRSAAAGDGAAAAIPDCSSPPRGRGQPPPGGGRTTLARGRAQRRGSPTTARTSWAPATRVRRRRHSRRGPPAPVRHLVRARRGRRLGAAACAPSRPGRPPRAAWTLASNRNRRDARCSFPKCSPPCIRTLKCDGAAHPTRPSSWSPAVWFSRNVRS